MKKNLLQTLQYTLRIGWVGRGMIALLLAAAAWLPAAQAHAQDAPTVPDADAEAIVQTIDTALTAWVDGDADALGAVTADPFTWINSSGHAFDRDGWIASATSDQVDVQKMEPSNLSMTPLGADTVQVTFDLDGAGAAGDQLIEFFEVVSSIVQRGDDGWLITFTQSTPRGDATDAWQATQQRIGEITAAAPAAVGAGATVVDLPTEAGGDPQVLRTGDNGWTCVSDDPNTPVNDNLCFDATWASWYEALMAGTEPTITTPSVAYALQGTGTASATDPAAMEPAAGEDWLSMGPSVLVIAPGGFDAAAFSTDPASGGPVLFFDGTPFEVLAVPVADPAPAADDGGAGN